MGEFSIVHWMILLVILLLLFGPSKLPGLGTSLGKAIRGFKSAMNDPDPPPTEAQRPEQIPAANPAAAQQEAQKSKDPSKV